MSIIYPRTITALITPFINDKIDFQGLINNIKFQIDQGVEGLLVFGSTGEDPTLNESEKEEILSIAVSEAKGKACIIAGTTHNNTKEAIQLTLKAEQLGADVALIATPYFNKPTQEGILRHFSAIRENTSIPIIVYNIPGRTGTNIETTTLLKIANLPKIIGVKEASGNIMQAGDVIHKMASFHPKFLVWSGDDPLTWPMMALGAYGVISVVSNLLPEKVLDLINAAAHDDMATAKKLHHELLPLFKMAFIETNPIPIKAAMNYCGFAAGQCRLPLCELTEANQKELENLLKQMNVIKNLAYSYA